MANVQRDLTKYGEKLQNVGKTLSVGLTAPLVAVGGLAIKAYTELEGVSNAFERLNDPTLLKELQDATKDTVSNLELMKAAVQANNFKIPLTEMGTLLEFARRRAKDTGESVDYLVNSIVTGIGRKSPLILDNLGISASSLSDELGGVSVASSNIADVTAAVGKIAREELEKMGEDTLTLGEQFLQIKTIVVNSMGDIGKILAGLLKPVIEFVKGIADRFKDLSPETKKWIVILGGVAAAIGPLLALAGTILPAIGTGFALLASPIGAIVAVLTAIGVIIYKNWEPIKKTLVDIANYFIDLYNESTAFRYAVEFIITRFKNLYEIGKFIFSTLGNIISRTGTAIKDTFMNMGEIIKAVLTGNISKIPELLAKNFSKSADNFGTFMKSLKDDFSVLEDNVDKNISEGIKRALRGKYSTIDTKVDTDPIKKKIEDAVEKGLGKGGSGTTDLTPTVSRIDTSGIFSGDIVNPLGTVSEQLDASVADMSISFQKSAEDMTAFQQAAQEIGLAVGATFEDMTGSLIDSMGLADHGFQGFAKNLAKTITKLISMLLANAVANAIAGSSESALGTGVAAVYTLPAFIATSVAGVLGAFAAIPKFASGGFVPGSSFYGDKVLSGLNSGELVLNVAQQRNVANALRSGNEPIIVGGTIEASGDVLRVVLDRADKNRNRFT